MNGRAWFTSVAMAAVLAGCGAGNGERPGGNPMPLIKAGDAKACAHPEIISALIEAISAPRGNESLLMPVNAQALESLEYPEVTIDRITLAAFDDSVSRLTCRGFSVMKADIGGPVDKFENEITYNIAISAEDDNEFIVSTSDSVAADRINIALVKQIASGVRQAENDQATAARLQGALVSAGATAESPAPSVAKAEPTAQSDSPGYSASYRNCMSSGEAAEGVTSAMAGCNSEELSKQDARLNDAYRAAMATRSPDQKTALRDAQRAWIKLRDTRCREDLEGGTMDILIEGGCILDMTAKRADELAVMARP